MKQRLRPERTAAAGLHAVDFGQQLRDDAVHDAACISDSRSLEDCAVPLRWGHQGGRMASVQSCALAGYALSFKHFCRKACKHERKLIADDACVLC